LKGRFVCVWNCLIFFLGEYSSIWREIYRVLSQIQSILLHGISGKNYSGTIFLKFCEKPRQSSSKICEISPYFPQFYFVLKNCVEKFTQVLSCAICTLRRRHVHKQITKRRYKEEKPGHFVFEKLVLFTLGLGHATPYSLGLLVWKFYQTFVIVCIEFWLRFEPQVCPTRFSINFLFIIVRVEMKVRLRVKLFDFFSRWILIRLTWNLSRFVPNSIQTLTWNFSKKLFRDNFSKILWKTKTIIQ